MKILVPTDFSELSTKALKVANSYAKLFNGKVYPFHSHVPITELDEPYALGMSSQVYQDYEEIESSIKEKLDSLADKYIDADKLGKTLIGTGNPAQSIVVESENFDIIIMSTHGRTGFTRFLLGSVAEKVLRLAEIPVMVVENESEIDAFKKILVTTDFSENANAAYPHALKIARKTGGSITLLHVLSFEQFNEEESDLSLKKIREQRLQVIEKEFFHELNGKVKSKVIVSDDSPHEAIIKHVQDNPYNLIVMSTVGRTGLRYLMMGSTTANVVRYVKTAVLSIRPEKSPTVDETE